MTYLPVIFAVAPAKLSTEWSRLTKDRLHKIVVIYSEKCRYRLKYMLNLNPVDYGLLAHADLRTLSVTYI